MKKLIRPKNFINGIINLPGDKSLAHRTLIFGAISNGTTTIKNFPFSKSVMSTLNCLRDLGANIKIKSSSVIIKGNGIYGLHEPKKILDAGTSGTTLRLILGLLAAQKFPSQIKCTGSLKNRPMDRVINPLRKMGAKIICDGNFKILPAKLSAIDYKMPVASAQVKSAIILASIYCDGQTKIIEPPEKKSRDHTEHMLNYFGADIKFNGNEIFICDAKNLRGQSLKLPADISSASFFIVLALIFQNSHLILNNVLINKRRIGIIKVLKKMGASIKFLSPRQIYNGEWVADIEVKSSTLNAIEIGGQDIVDMIDEIPIFIVAALFANGTTIIKDAAELHFKESDRINCLAEEFNKLGAKIKPTHDGFIIESGSDFKSALANSHDDHRIAMSLAIFSLAFKNELAIENSQCVIDSFPQFFSYIDNFF